MKIIRQQNKNIVELYKLNSGDVFAYEGNIYIRIKNVPTTQAYVSCARISNGYYVEIVNSTMVTYFPNAELVTNEGSE